MNKTALYALLAVIAFVALYIAYKAIEFVMPFIIGSAALLLIGFALGFWAARKKSS